MSVSRLDLIRYFEQNGFFLRREGSNHSIYSNGKGVNVPVKRHRIFDRITANELCKEAGIPKIF